MSWINTNGGRVFINKADHDNLSKRLALGIYLVILEVLWGVGYEGERGMCQSMHY